MNTGRVYVCQIYINSKYDFLFPGIYRTYGDFVKNSFVYHKDNGKFVDLITNQVYKTNEDLSLGEMFVNTRSLIPLGEVIDIKSKNLSKKRILKLLYEEAVKREGEVEKNEKSI